MKRKPKISIKDAVAQIREICDSADIKHEAKLIVEENNPWPFVFTDNITTSASREVHLEMRLWT